MHVVQLGPYPPPWGGVQANLVAIREYLLAHGIRCSVINLTRHRQADRDGVYYPNSPWTVVWLLIRLRPQVVHLHVGGAVTLRLLLLGLVCSVLPGSKSVLTLHSGGYPTSREGLTAGPWTLRGIVFRRFGGVIAVNQQIKEMFQKFGVSAKRIRVIAPHALPAAVPNGKLPETLENFFAYHQPVLLSMGWLEPEYDYPLQIRALGQVRARHPRAGLVILGDGRLRRELAAQIERSGYGSDVLLGGDVPHETALAALARSDAFLRTTLYDGDSISVREALHLRVPVIASDNGMRPTGVRLVSTGDLQSAVDGILAELEQGRKIPAQPLEADDQNVAAVLAFYQEIPS